jgi:fumarate reductase subunit C
MPNSWWLARRSYTSYMAREASCVFIGAYSFLILVGLYRLSQGRDQYAAFLDALQSPLAMVFHGAALVFALVHTVSWFSLAPKAMPLQFGEKKLAGGPVVLAHYAVWIVVSAVVLLAARV